jgi:hypothetical protein
MKGQTIRVEPFVLPHHSKITPDEHRLASGPNGWNAHQGIYLYRNNRLIVPGSWLDLGFVAEEHCKLARIRVDIPNSLDLDWKIDVRKSQAEIPLAIKRRMKTLAAATRKKATEVYRTRGKSVRRESLHTDKGIVWKVHSNRGKYSYKINRDYPILSALLESMDSQQKKIFNTMLRLIEETIPVAHISVQATQFPDSHTGPLEAASEKERYEALECAYQAIRDAGQTHKMAMKILPQIEPFSLYPELIEKLGENKVKKGDL